MPTQGLCLRVVHTGLAANSIHVSDIRDGIDMARDMGFRKPGPVYVPNPANGGVALLVYSGDVAVSFESGGIRRFIDDGYLTATFVAGIAFGSLLAPAPLLWGADSVGSTTTARFLFPGFSDGLAQTVAPQFRSTRAATLQNLRVHHRAGAGNGNNIVYTVRVNGVASTLTATLASTAVDGTDLVNTVAVVAGDLLDITVTKAIDIAASPSDITATLEFV